ncbi:MAG: sensor domain-containing diguanylate cyclase [Candidatus Pacearchaeota archaeon]
MNKEKIFEYSQKEIKVLRDLYKIMGSTDNLDIFLSKVSDLIKFNIKSKYVFFVLKDNDNLNIKYYEILAREIKEDFRDLLLEIASDVMRKGGAIIINNTKKHKRLRKFNIKNILVVSLMLYSDIIGAIFLFQKLDGFSKFDLRLVSSIANLTAIGIEKIKMKKELEEKEKKVTKLYAKLYEKESKKAIIDSLTGLYNKSFFIDKLEELIKEKKKISLIMFDIDYFKNYNDVYGHLAGDDLLKEIGSTVKDILSKYEKYNIKYYACRYGGEEFAIIIEASLDIAKEIAEVIRQEIENFYYARKSKRFITASFGVAEIKENEKLNHFIERTDKLLYKAKQLGKNLVLID